MSNHSGPMPVPQNVRGTIDGKLYSLATRPDEMDWIVRRLAEGTYVQGWQDGHNDGMQENWSRTRAENAALEKERNELIFQFKGLLGEDAEEAWKEQGHPPCVEFNIDVTVIDSLRKLLGLGPLVIDDGNE